MRAPYFLFAALFAVAPSISSAQNTCNPGDFQAKNSGQLSFAQQFSHYQTSTDYREDVVVVGGKSTIPIQGLDVDFSSEKKRERFSQSTRTSLIVNNVQYAKSWAESALDANGLAGYLKCLEKQDGFNVIPEELASVSIVKVIWTPGENGHMTSHPKIVSSSNVSNTQSLNRQLSSPRVWGSEAAAKELQVTRTDPAAAASFTITNGSRSSRVVVLPPRSLPSQPAVPQQLSWSGHNNSNLVHEIPVDAIGKTMVINVDGDAFSSGRGRIQGRLYVYDLQGKRRQIHATPIHTQSQGMGVDFKVRFQVKRDDYLIGVEVQNWNAEARGVRAVVRY